MNSDFNFAPAWQRTELFALDRVSGAGHSVSRTEGTRKMRQRVSVTPVQKRPPDVEVAFSFNDVRKSHARDGYRPAHRLTDTCLTTGVHHYYDMDSVPPGASARGTITFLSPEAYPHCLWVGKRIPMQEGARGTGNISAGVRMGGRCVPLPRDGQCPAGYLRRHNAGWAGIPAASLQNVKSTVRRRVFPAADSVFSWAEYFKYFDEEMRKFREQLMNFVN